MKSEGPHRRFNPLTGDWVLVSPQRLARPWVGETSAPLRHSALRHDPDCHLCPGSLRSLGARNPRYSGCHVFDNDFPALLAASDTPVSEELLRAEPETGVCRVLCYTPDHSRTLADMTTAEARDVVDLWAQQYDELSARGDIAAVTLFENRGTMMGASNPHPHGQVWATSSVPDELFKEDQRQRAYHESRGGALLEDYIARELEIGERVVMENDHFVVVTPFWAVWPFETMLVPRRPVSSLPELGDQERNALAEMTVRLMRTYDQAFGVSASYSMGWHQRPTRQRSAPHFIAHAHICPPLVRPPNVRKFMVGFEMFAMTQRDLTPEAAAAMLRAATADRPDHQS